MPSIKICEVFKESNIKSLDLNRISYITKFIVADAAHEQKMFRSAKSSEFFAVFDYILRGFRADVLKFFKFFSGCDVKIYSRFADYDLILYW